jgi:syntaxin-binding protein 5
MTGDADYSPMATCLAMNPRDLNILLIGYKGGVVAYNIQKAEVEKTFEMTLPPGQSRLR